MTIVWQETKLPADPAELGHGVCVVAYDESHAETRVVAFVEGFAWLHKETDAVVRFDGRFFPVSDSLRRAIEEIVYTRSRRLDGKLVPGFRVHING